MNLRAFISIYVLVQLYIVVRECIHYIDNTTKHYSVFSNMFSIKQLLLNETPTEQKSYIYILSTDNVNCNCIVNIIIIKLIQLFIYLFTRYVQLICDTYRFSRVAQFGEALIKSPT